MVDNKDEGHKDATLRRTLQAEFVLQVAHSLGGGDPMSKIRATALGHLLFPAAFCDGRKADILSAHTWIDMLADARTHGQRSAEGVDLLQRALHAAAVQWEVHHKDAPLFRGGDAEARDAWLLFVRQELGRLQPPEEEGALRAWRAALTHSLEFYCRQPDGWPLVLHGHTPDLMVWLCHERCTLDFRSQAPLLAHLLGPAEALRAAPASVVEHLRAPRDVVLAEARAILSPARAAEFNVDAADKCDELLCKAGLFGPNATVQRVDDLLLAQEQLQAHDMAPAPGILARHLAGTAPCAYMDPCSAAYHESLRKALAFPDVNSSTASWTLARAAKASVESGQECRAVAACLALWKRQPAQLLGSLIESKCQAVFNEYLVALLPLLDNVLPPLLLAGNFPALALHDDRLRQPVLSFCERVLTNWAATVKPPLPDGATAPNPTLLAVQVVRLLLPCRPAIRQTLADALPGHLLAAAFQAAYTGQLVQPAKHLCALLKEPTPDSIVCWAVRDGWPVRVCAALLAHCDLPVLHDVLAQPNMAAGAGPALRSALFEFVPGLEAALQVVYESDYAQLPELQPDLRATAVAAIMDNSETINVNTVHRLWEAMTAQDRLSGVDAFQALLGKPWTSQGFIISLWLDRRGSNVLKLSLSEGAWCVCLQAVRRDAGLIMVLDKLVQLRHHA